MRSPATLLARSAALAVAVAAVSPTARAQDDMQSERHEPTKANSLFDVGQRFASERRYDAACPKFEESYTLDPSMTTLYHMADCWEHTGRRASAWARFVEVAEVAGRAGRRDLEASARARASALEAKLPLLVLEVKAKDTGLEITRDGEPVSSALWGTPVPVDPGKHTIDARAPNKRPRKLVVDMPPDAQTLSVTVPVLDDESGQSAPTAADEARTSISTSTPRERPGLNGAVIATGVVLGGLGVAGIAVGAVSGLKFLSKKDEAASICPTGVACTPGDIAAYETTMADARSARKLSLIGFGVGGAALLGGAILLISAPRSAATTGISVAPAVGAGSVGATIAGRW
jgi:hypothetical protein